MITDRNYMFVSFHWILFWLTHSLNHSSSWRLSVERNRCVEEASKKRNKRLIYIHVDIIAHHRMHWFTMALTSTSPSYIWRRKKSTKNCMHSLHTHLLQSYSQFLTWFFDALLFCYALVLLHVVFLIHKMFHNIDIVPFCHKTFISALKLFRINYLKHLINMTKWQIPILHETKKSELLCICYIETYVYM